MTDERIYPDLSGVAKQADINKKPGGKFQPEYINWARIAAYMREHAPGWQPIARIAEDGGLAHKAPDGTYYLLIYFTHPSGAATTLVPHAVMDNAMHAKKNPDARDISDAFVRGMCKAAALHFGLAWEMWSKDDPLGRVEDEPGVELTPKSAAKKKSKAPPYENKDEALNAIYLVKTIEGLNSVSLKIVESKAILSDEAFQEIVQAGKEKRADLQERAAVATGD